MVVWFLGTEIGMLAWITHGFWVVGWEISWDLDVWDKSDGYGMKNMNSVWDRRNSMSLVGRSHGGV